MSQSRPRPFEKVPDSDPAVSFLRASYPQHLFEPSKARQDGNVFVTLTYAQSLDAKIAGKGGKQLILSGKQSMELTHRMRELHDSILVGAGTMLNDDPQLNARIPSLLPVEYQPTPIVLDRDLRTPPDCKLLKNYQAGIGKAPVIVSDSSRHVEGSDPKQKNLEKAGAILFKVPFDSRGHLSLETLLDTPALQEYLGRSLMIEGGSSIISGFLPSPKVDLVVATVAPIYVGDGVDLIRPGTQVPELEHVRTQIFGRDTVFASKPKRREGKTDRP
ncbi:hypothetical protein JCM5350_002910 [Sporobolomyces pararoseus]